MNYKYQKYLNFKLLLFIWFIWPVNVFSQWELILSRDSIQVYKKPVSGKLFYYKAEAQFAVDIYSLYDFFTSFENYNQWISYCEETSIVFAKPDSLFSVYFLFNMPWPIANRDALVDFVIDRIEYNKSIHIQTINSKNQYKKTFGTIRIENFDIVFDLIALSDNEVKFIMQGSYHYKGIMPSFLVEKMLKWGPYDTILRIKNFVE